MAVEPRPIFGSLTRISNLQTEPFATQRLSREHWATGDYVVSRVTSCANAGCPVEQVTGRLAELSHGDLFIGALGVRAATLEAVGSWEAVQDDGVMHAMTAAGLMGKATSVSPYGAKLLDVQYVGHVIREGRKVVMTDFVAAPPSGRAGEQLRNLVLLIGTSMSSGKTTAGKVIVRQLCRLGLRVAGVKLTGAGRYRDVLGMRDAGADHIFDFVDAGLPSTVCSPERYRQALKTVLHRIADCNADAVITEAGASPVEPYNGDTLMETLREQICFTVLCANDPYAVVGVTQGFGMRPDVVAGVAANTSAGVNVVQRLTGLPALNLMDPASHAPLCEMIQRKLRLAAGD